MRWLLLCLVLGCVPAAVLRGEHALETHQPAEALAAFESVLRDDATNSRARAGRERALSELFAAQLSASRTAREARRFEEALDAVKRATDLVRWGAQRGEALTVERDALGKAIASWVEEPLTLSQPLEAEARLANVERGLERAGLSDIAAHARTAITAVGARRCVVLGGLAKTPWLARFIAQYCQHFGAAHGAVPAMPERRSRLAYTEALRGGDELPTDLRLAVEASFERSPWYGSDASPGLPVSLSGAIESEVERQPVDTFVTWTELETYSTTETVPESYQETYQSYEQQPYTRTITTSESYTYSCGSGTRYQTCYGTRPVTRTVTEYRGVTVTRTRTATRMVTKTVYKTRPVTRRFDFKAVNVTVRHASKVSVSFALPSTDAPLTVQADEHQSGDDLEHEVSHARAGLAPHRAAVPTVKTFQRKVLTSLTAQLESGLERAWRSAFCRGALEVPEESARCLAAATAPAEAWTGLARFTGEAPPTLQLVFSRVR